jgi:uncharacterized protein YndB with AHSA1/START domain
MADPTRNQLRSQVRIHADPAKVWAALVEPARVRVWWGATQGVVEPQKGGAWALAWAQPGGYRYVLAGLIRVWRPEKRLLVDPLVYFNAEHPVPGPMRLSLSLTAKGGSTRLVVLLRPRGDDPGWTQYREEAQVGWREALGNLKNYLERDLP